MSFFSRKRRVYPIFVFLAGLFFLVFGLCTARSLRCTVFLGCAYLWLCLFGGARGVLRVLPMLALFGGAFGAIAYFAYGHDSLSALAMVNRFGAVLLAAALGMSTEAADMTRCLRTLKVPRGVTLGMLIATSFPPVLGAEIRRVREAMRTRGAGSALNPRIFYRAFLVPLVMRLVDISDTLSLSVETRGFSLEKVPDTVYKKETVCLSDVIFVLGIAVGALLAVVL